MAIFGKKKTDKSKADEKKSASKKTVKKTAKVSDAKKASMKEMYSDGKKTGATEKKATETKKRKPGFAYRVLIKPLITEKASILQQENKYIFEVCESSNKIEIADAIEEVYNVRPTSVNTVRVIGKKVRSGKNVGKRKDWKKAVVTLPAGKIIKIYEGV